jgi:branched-chain amino acid transport system substrate-binding protein
VQRLVEQEKVIAFVHQAAPITGYSSVEYVNRVRVPVVGSDAGDPWFYDSPMFFPQGTSGTAEMRATMAAVAAAGKGKKKVGILSCVEVPFCHEIRKRGPADAQRYHLEVVYQGSASLTQPDFTSQCLEAQRNGAEILLTVIDSASVQRIGRSCASISYKPLIGIFFATAIDGFKNDPNLEGGTVAMPTIPWFLNESPPVREYLDALRQFAPNTEANASSVSGWTSAKLFERAAGLAPGSDVTSDAILRGLWSVRNDDLGGITQPLTFTEGQNAPKVVCYWVAIVGKGKWQTLHNKAERTCESELVV